MTEQELRLAAESNAWEIEAVAGRLGVTTKTTYALFKRAGINFRAEKKAFTDRAKVFQAVKFREALSEAGYNMTELAKRMGVSENIVRLRATRLGLKKITEPMRTCPIRLSSHSAAIIQGKLDVIEKTSGLKLTLSEAVRAVVMEMSDLPVAELHAKIIKYREGIWNFRAGRFKG